MEFEIDSWDISTSSVSNVPVLTKRLSYNDFFTNFMRPNVPCIIQGVTSDWEANQWVQNLDFLKNRYGSCDVTVYDCNERYFNSQKTEVVKLEAYLDSWGSQGSKCKYLKDWHLKNTYKNDNFYDVPIYFASDWLNEFLVAKNDDDYRFVYMGQAGTWTPFHSDVFNSFSWSANVCGSKRWILLPPNEENLLRDSLNNLPYDISDTYHKVKHFELIQKQGEAIFVPSGWYHQVWNLEDTISVNHNWVNGCNIAKMWQAIEENLNKVKKEIGDCRDMDGFIRQCQVVLKASFGIDFFKFFEFLRFVGEKRLKQVEEKNREVLFHGHVLGAKHARFDLGAVRCVLEKFVGHCDVPELFGNEPESFLNEISKYNLETYKL